MYRKSKYTEVSYHQTAQYSTVLFIEEYLFINLMKLQVDSIINTNAVKARMSKIKTSCGFGRLQLYGASTGDENAG